MKIPGTKECKADVVFDTEFFEVGDITTGFLDDQWEVYKKPDIENGKVKYKIVEILSGEELEIAIQHFKFLMKYGLG